MVSKKFKAINDEGCQPSKGNPETQLYNLTKEEIPLLRMGMYNKKYKKVC
jgi:hypothetical protein